MELDELQEHWEKDLGVAENFLPNEPMAALAATRAISAEVEDYLEAHPDADTGRALTQLRLRARAAFARSHEASERWLAQCAERGRRWHEHELERAELPMSRLRSPWPPRVSV